MHRLLAKQLETARRFDGSIDLDRLLELVGAAYVEADRDRRRTDRSIELMIEEVDTLNRDLEAQVAARTRELDATRHLLQATFDNVSQGIVMVDADNRVRFWNRHAARCLGVAAETLAAFPDHRELMAGQLARGRARDLSGSFDDWRAAGEGAGEHVQEWDGADGVSLEIRSAPMANGGFVRTYLDITERKSREDALMRSERYNREISMELRATLENMSQGIIVANSEGDVRVINQRALDLMGLPQSYLYDCPGLIDIRAHVDQLGLFKHDTLPVVREMNRMLLGKSDTGTLSAELERTNGQTLEAGHRKQRAVAS